MWPKANGSCVVTTAITLLFPVLISILRFKTHQKRTAMEFCPQHSCGSIYQHLVVSADRSVARFRRLIADWMNRRLQWEGFNRTMTAL